MSGTLPLTGKYESNHTAHQLAANYSNLIVEALETLIELHLATRDRVESSEEEKSRHRSSEEEKSRHRSSAEVSARRLLLRLEGATRPDSGLSLLPSSGARLHSRGSCAWEDSSGYSQTTR